MKKIQMWDSVEMCVQITYGVSAGQKVAVDDDCGGGGWCVGNNGIKDVGRALFTFFPLNFM